MHEIKQISRTLRIPVKDVKNHLNEPEDKFSDFEDNIAASDHERKDHLKPARNQEITIQELQDNPNKT